MRYHSRTSIIGRQASIDAESCIRFFLLPKVEVYCNHGVGTEENSCHALYNIRDTFLGLDHVPLVARVRILPRGAHCKKRKVLRYDRRALQKPDNVQLLQHVVNTMPAIPFWLEPTSHSYLITQRIQRILVQLFPMPLKSPRLPVISEATFAFYYDKSQSMPQA